MAVQDGELRGPWNNGHPKSHVYGLQVTSTAASGLGVHSRRVRDDLVSTVSRVSPGVQGTTLPSNICECPPSAPGQRAEYRSRGTRARGGHREPSESGLR